MFRAWPKLLLGLVFIVAGCIPGSPAWACGGMAEVSWKPPTTNTDGSPLTDLDHYELYWRVGSGTGYPSSARVSGSSHVVTGLPPTGNCYFVVAAVNSRGVIGELSYEAVKVGPGEAPGKPSIAVTWAIPAPSKASVTVTNVNQFSEFDLELVGTVDFRLTAPSGQVFDYCTVGTTTPSIGSNNDGRRAPEITIRGPLKTFCDLDSSGGGTSPPFSGFAVTVNGVRKPLVKSGGSWAVSF